MEPVFLDFNCLTLIACLNFLLVEFSLSKKSTQLKTLIVAATAINLLDTSSAVAAAASTNNANIFYYFRESPSSKSSANGKEPFRSNYLSSFSTLPFLEPVSSSSSSLSKSSRVTSSSNLLENLLLQKASLRNSKRKQTRSNSPTSNNSKNSNDILLIHSNENKNSSSLLSLLSLFPSSSSSSLYPLALPSSLNKQKDNDSSISASKNKQSSKNASDDITSYELTKDEVTKFQGKRHSVSKHTENKLVAPQGKFSALQFTSERQQKENTGATATTAAVLAVDPFPVSYLTNSNYEYEPPLMLTNPLGSGMNAGESNHDMEKNRILLGRTRSSNLNNAKVQRASGRSSSVRATDDDTEEYPNSPSIEYLAMPLQGGNNDEILLDFTTVSPEVSTMFVGSPQDFESPSPALDNNNDTNETVDIDDKAILYNQTAGTIPLRKPCNDTIQCFGEHVECRLSICKCQLGYLPRVDNGELCGEASAHHVEVPTTDPTMIGVVVGLALMSVTLCIVLRLFAKARFRENRTIFNTPNPRLMNVSLLKGSKTLLRGNSAGGGQRSRRGSQVSMNSGQAEGETPANATSDGNGISTAGSSSHPHRVKPSRTLSTDTTNLEGTPTSSRPAREGRSKFRQDSVASNV